MILVNDRTRGPSSGVGVVVGLAHVLLQRPMETFRLHTHTPETR